MRQPCVSLGTMCWSEGDQRSRDLKAEKYLAREKVKNKSGWLKRS